MNSVFAVRVAVDGAVRLVRDPRFAAPGPTLTTPLGHLLVHTPAPGYTPAVNHVARHIWATLAGSGAPPMLRGPVLFTGRHPDTQPRPLDRDLIHAIQGAAHRAPLAPRRRCDLSAASTPSHVHAGSDAHSVFRDPRTGRWALALCDARDGRTGGAGVAAHHAARLASETARGGDPLGAVWRRLRAAGAEAREGRGMPLSAIVATWGDPESDVVRLAWFGSNQAFRLPVGTGARALGLTADEDVHAGPLGPVAYREVPERTTAWLALATDGAMLHALDAHHVGEILWRSDSPKEAAGILARDGAHPGAGDEGTVVVVDIHHRPYLPRKEGEEEK
ncbi:hypothetical protein ACIQ9P_03675 [Kitasatospora sp. NPDC094019]|uniref:hypothetical protein n=1 Tax=Kitasatospora sp. NPDC094019 TaxID=3364091 RepID=UPI00380B144A